MAKELFEKTVKTVKTVTPRKVKEKSPPKPSKSKDKNSKATQSQDTVPTSVEPKLTQKELDELAIKNNLIPENELKNYNQTKNVENFLYNLQTSEKKTESINNADTALSNSSNNLSTDDVPIKSDYNLPLTELTSSFSENQVQTELTSSQNNKPQSSKPLPVAIPRDLPPTFIDKLTQTSERDSNTPPNDLPPSFALNLILNSELPLPINAIQYQNNQELNNQLQTKELEIEQVRLELSSVVSASEETKQLLQQSKDEIEALKQDLAAKTEKLQQAEALLKEKDDNYKLLKGLFDQVVDEKNNELKALDDKLQQAEDKNTELKFQIEAIQLQFETFQKTQETQINTLKNEFKEKDVEHITQLQQKDEALQKTTKNLNEKNVELENIIQASTNSKAQAIPDAKLINEVNFIKERVKNTYTYSGRSHKFFEVTQSNIKFNGLKAQYVNENNEPLKGDDLKRKILDILKGVIKDASTKEEVDTIKEEYQAEIRLLKETQGLTYTVLSWFGKNTSSMNVLEKMLTTRRDDVPSTPRQDI